MQPHSSFVTVTDQFCGAGGSTTGAKKAGAEIWHAMNHWKLAGETYNINNPGVNVDITDISATDPRRYRSTDILITSPECFPAGSLVLTRNGFCPIEDIVVGDLVLTHKNRWMRVVRTQSKQAEETIVVAGQGHTLGIEVTPNHKFYARTQDRKWDNLKRDYDRKVFGDPDWVRADELVSKKYRWSTPSRVDQDFKDVVMPSGFGEYAPSAWWLIGRWLGDGSLSFGRHSDVTISCGKHEESELTDRLARTGANWRRHVKRTAINFTLTNRDLRDWLFHQFGHGAANKSIPGWAMGLSESLRLNLLEGYVSADGHISNRRTRIDTVSKSLAFSVRLLAESLGYRAGVYLYEQHCKVIEGRSLNVLPIWAVAWESNNSERAAFEEDGLSWGLVKSVRPGRKNVTVYNIEVEEDHSYIVEGIVVKNCTNHSLAKGSKRAFYKQDLFGNVLVKAEDERSRATMWDVPRFAEFHNYRIIIVENVVEAAKWMLWESWLHAMTALGYEHEVVYFNSMFRHPVPQSRDRLYCVLWKKGNRRPNLEFNPIAQCQFCGEIGGAKQTWKKVKKWGRYGRQYFYRCGQCHKRVEPFYYAAFNLIDWSIPAERIGDRKKPLQPKTMARVKYGFDQFGHQPLIVTGRYTSGVECRVKPAFEEPLPTQPGDSSHYIASPWLVETSYSHSGDNRASSSSDPLVTQSARQSIGMAGFLSKQYSGNADPKSMGIGLNSPTGTVTTDDHHALVSFAPYLIKTVRQENDDAGSSSVDPARTQTTCQDTGLVAPAFIAENHGTSLASGLDDALMCVAAGGNHHALISTRAYLTYYYGNSHAGRITDPLGTVTAIDKVGLVQQALEKMTVDDLTFRMLAPHEIQAAMAFPSDYIVMGTKKEKVRQLGNAVTPPVMEMIIQRCMESLA